MTIYCTIDNVKKFAGTIAYKDLGFESEDEYTDYTDLILDGASRTVDNYCNRPDNFFQNAGVNVTEYFNGKGSAPPSHRLQYDERYDAWNEEARMFRLNQRPVLSITSVSELLSGTWTARTEGDSTSSDFRHINGVVRFTKNIPKSGWGNVKVVYKAGYSTCPRDIIMATAMLCANYVQLKGRDRTVAIFKFRRPQPMEFEASDVMTPEVEAILMKYKRMLFGSS